MFVPGAVAIQKGNFPLFLVTKRDAGMGLHGVKSDLKEGTDACHNGFPGFTVPSWASGLSLVGVVYFFTPVSRNPGKKYSPKKERPNAQKFVVKCYDDDADMDYKTLE